MDGILNIYKPAGCTSHDVVQRVRSRFGIRRVGHGGTLDPMAEGVLVLALGKATRLLEFISSHDKDYRARLLLGLSTDTQDVQGQVVAEHSAAEVTLETLTEAVANFEGKIPQIPPMYSAIKLNGVPLYRLARAGKTVERRPREVNVRAIQIISFDPGERARAELVCSVSAGCYIRTLCSDIGDALGVGGCMEWLVREASGWFCLADAHPADEVAKWSSADLQANLLPPDTAVHGLPRIDVGQAAAEEFCHGRRISAGPTGEGVVRVYGESGQLLGIGEVEQGDSTRIQPLKVLCDV